MNRQLKIDGPELYKLLGGQNGPVWNTVLRLGTQVQNKAKDFAPVDRGRLRQSITLEMRRQGDAPVAVVGTNVKYALFVHEGTGEFGPRGVAIRPKTAKFLAWRVRNTSGTKARYAKKGGKTVWAFAKEVKGVRPRPFLLNALMQVMGFAGPYRT